MKLGKKLTLIVMLGVLPVTLPGIALIYNLTMDNYLNNTLKHLEIMSKDDINMQVGILRSAENSLQTLSSLLTKSIITPSNNLTSENFDTLMTADHLGVTRNRRELFNGKFQAGLFIPPHVQLNATSKQHKLQNLNLITQFGLATLQHYEAIWFHKADKSTIIFDQKNPDYIYNLQNIKNSKLDQTYKLSNPKINPNRKFSWLPVRYEPNKKIWVMSVVYPIDVDKRWLGSLGHDIALTNLLHSFKESDHHHSSQHFLIDQYDNYIMAGKWQQQLEHNDGKFKPDLTAYPDLEKLFQQIKNQPNKSLPEFLNFDGREYIAFPIYVTELDWTYIHLVAVDEVLSPVQNLFLSIAILILSIALLTGLLININVRLTVIKPLLYLEKITRRYGKGDLNQRINISGNNEITHMGKVFNAMADNFAKNQSNLKQSEARYRFVLNSSHEAILILDQAGKLLFTNPAFPIMLGCDLEKLNNQCFWDLLHPDDFLNKQANFQAVWDKDNKESQEEFRIRAKHNEYIWVKLFLRTVIDDTGEKVYSGTLIDISDRIFANRIDAALSNADTMALSGILVNEISQMLCEQLAELFGCPLVWILLKENHDIRLNIQASAGKNTELLQHFLHQHPNDPVVKAFLNGSTKTKNPNVDTEFFSDVAIPLKDQKNILGVLSFQFHSHYKLNPQALERLENLANRISLTLQRVLNQHWLRLQKTAMESVANAICITDSHGKIEWINEAFSQLSGYSLDEALGNTLNKLVNSHYHSDKFWVEFWRTLKAKKVWRGENVNTNKSGQHYIVAQSVTPLLNTNNDVTHYIAIQEDITEKKAIEKKMEFIATHDTLTGLANRSLLIDHIDLNMSQAQRHHEQMAILFLDLDRFKLINDTLGHKAGDDLLQQVAERLKTTVSSGDLVARLGGDEFVIVINYIDSEPALCKIAAEIIALFETPFNISDKQHYITTSLGICLYPLDGNDTQTLIKKADTAMYYAKEQGKNNFQFFTDALNERVVKRVNLENHLRKAIKNQEFELYYQPQIPTSNNNNLGLEALIRWLHPEKGMILPTEFIPIAEETGLIVPLGAWILKQACKQIKQWHDQGLSDLRVSVNLSAQQFKSKTLLDDITNALIDSNLSAKYLVCELTESMMMENIEDHIKVLHAVKALGVQVSIDDFGTGYSSLSYLKRFPINELKIDKSFIDDIETDENDRNIVRSIITLGHNLNLDVIAEGVETENQLKFLQDNNCDYIQGYHFSKPLQAKNVFDFINNLTIKTHDNDNK